MSARDTLRNLHDAALAARPFVEQACDRWEALLMGRKSQDAAELLERLDGAIADAGEALVGEPADEGATT